MVDIPWDAVRTEIAQAGESVQYAHDSDSRRRATVDHLRTAILLLTGATAQDILGHEPKTRRDRTQ